MTRAPRPPADDDVPRLPRGKGFALSTPQLIRIVMVATALVALIVLQRPCARSVSKFVTGFGQVDAGAGGADARPAPPVVPAGELLRADMTEAEMAVVIARARAAAAAEAAALADAGLAAAADAGGDAGRAEATPPPP
ncbi:MAG: hypothetical protein HS111_34235 [Kofleriaceae bacterium]|nr:hypothetical protein [Kofleriaceae bacterium]MCL4225018.1 hypothetical protein [Myxococcales bacterium]